MARDWIEEQRRRDELYSAIIDWFDVRTSGSFDDPDVLKGFDAAIETVVRHPEFDSFQLGMKLGGLWGGDSAEPEIAEIIYFYERRALARRREVEARGDVALLDALRR